MRIAITGAAGRVGRGVVEQALLRGYDVTAVDRSVPVDSTPPGGRLTWKEVDLRRYEDVEGAIRGCDAVIHLAAHASPLLAPNHIVHNDNVVSSYNVLAAAAALGIPRYCQASSVNAIGGAYSRSPTYDYFPVDEQHPTHNEDPYSLSKWICEAQADSIARRHPEMVIASLRFHAVVPDREEAMKLVARRGEASRRDLWGYTTSDGAASACFRALEAAYQGHEAFLVIAARSASDLSSEELCQRFYPGVPLRERLTGDASFFDCGKARRMLGWRDESPENRP